MLKSIDFWPLVPKKLSVESSINDDVHQKSMFKVLTRKLYVVVVVGYLAVSYNPIKKCKL